MTFSWGLIHTKSFKQQLNTKKSKDYDVVGSIYNIPCSIWFGIYMEHQWYRFKQNQIVQYNTSAMKWKIMSEIHVRVIPDS